MNSLKSALANIKVGDSGYVYVVKIAAKLEDSEFIYHPVLGGKKIGEINDPSIQLLTKTLAESKSGFYRYDWSNASGVKKEKIVAFDTSPSWGWMIVSGSFIEEFIAEASRLRNYLITLCVALGLVMVLVLGWVISHQLHPLQDLLAALRRIGSGDLSQPIRCNTGTTKNEVTIIAQGINDTQRKISELVTNLSETAQQVEFAAQSLDQASGEVVTGSTQQSSSAADLAAAVEELSSSVVTIAEYASKTNHQAEAAREAARNGRNTVDAMVVEMQRISGEMQHAADDVKRLGTQTAQISGIVQVIKDVADQTNLLALNAAIEAARAGEQGRGFAVVADEVRNLANRTTHSTQEISETIGQIQGKAQQAVQHISGMSQTMRNGVELANNAGEVLRALQEQSISTATSVGDIAAATREQSVTATNAALDVERIAHMAEKNTQIAKNNRSETERLGQLARKLRQAVGQFRI